MKYYVMPFFLFLLIQPALAQKSAGDPAKIQEFAMPSSKIKSTRNVEYRGSPYFNEDWAEGYVIFNSGSHSDTIDLKYSSYGNEVLFERNGRLLAVTPNTFSGFVLMRDDQTVTFRKGYSSSKYKINPSQLLQVVYDGSVKFLIHHENELDKANRPDPLSGQVVHRFRTDETAYLIDAGGQWHQVDMEQEEILNVLESQHEVLKKYAETHDLDFENPEDIKQILAHYDAITSTQN